VLTRVFIEHFKSCWNLTIDAIGPSLVLVGRNGSGKTNILNAILWAASEALSNRPVDSSSWDGLGKSVTLEFHAGGYQYFYWIKSPPNLRSTGVDPSSYALEEAVACSTSHGEWEVIASRKGPEVKLPGMEPMIIAPSTPFLSFLFAFLPPDHTIIERLGSVKDFLIQVRYYPLIEMDDEKDLSELIKDDEYDRWENSRDILGNREDSVAMKLISMYRNSPEDLQEVKDLLGDDGLGLVREIRIHPIPLPTLSSEQTPGIIHFVTFCPSGWPRVGDGGFGFSDLSLGTRRIIRMVVSMIFDKSSVMLIEHPEDGIHRRLTEKVFDVLQAYTDPSQIIVSSHSSLVFNMLDPAEIRLVSMNEGKTEVRALTEEEADQARNYVKQEGTLTEYLDVLIEQ
jgi:hypothetical protein